MIQGPPGVTAFGFVTSYERKGFYAPAEVHAHVGAFDLVDFDGDLIDMKSSRYRLFNKSAACEYCGIEGLYYAKERAARFSKNTQTYHPTTNKWHFNLYAVDSQGALILMTKDHVIPRSRGGADADENYVPACQPCNMRKSNRMPGESDRDFYKVRRPASNDPRNRAQRAADRRAKRAIVKGLQREDAAGGLKVTHTAWGGYLGDDTKAMGSEVQRTLYVRNWLVFTTKRPHANRLFQTEGVSDQYKHRAKGVWVDTGEAAEVDAQEAIGFANKSAAQAYIKGATEAAVALQERLNAERRVKQAEMQACIDARLGTRDVAWGVVVGDCDKVGLTSNLLVGVKKWLVFTGGCHGTGSLFETDKIEHPGLHFVSGWWRYDGLDRVLPPKHTHCAFHAQAGFDTKAEAMDYIQTLLDAALIKDAA